MSYTRYNSSKHISTTQLEPCGTDRERRVVRRYIEIYNYKYM